MRINESHCRINLMLGLAGLLALVTGCGGGLETTSVSGTVTIKGEPIPADAEATITFATKEGDEELSTTVPITGGKYESPETPQGSVLVTFAIFELGPPQVSDRTGQEYREQISLVPADKAGGQTVDITEATGNLDFDL